MSFTTYEKNLFQTKMGNRIYAKKFCIMYKDIISFDYDYAYSVEQDIYDSLCKKFKKQKSENMRYLILKSPKTKNKRCDIIVYLEFDTRKSIRTDKKLEVTLENLDRIGMGYATYTRVGEYAAVTNRNSFLSKILIFSNQHHKSKWEGFLNFDELPSELALNKNVLLYQEKIPNQVNRSLKVKAEKKVKTFKI